MPARNLALSGPFVWFLRVVPASQSRARGPHRDGPYRSERENTHARPPSAAADAAQPRACVSPGAREVPRGKMFGSGRQPCQRTLITTAPRCFLRAMSRGLARLTPAAACHWRALAARGALPQLPLALPANYHWAEPLSGGRGSSKARHTRTQRPPQREVPPPSLQCAAPTLKRPPPPASGRHLRPLRRTTIRAAHTRCHLDAQACPPHPC